MQRRLTLVAIVLSIAGAILYLENPRFIQTWFGAKNEETIVAFGLVTNPSEDEVGLEVGKAAPDFTLQDLNGTPTRLSDFRGEKFVLINFWASWCGPCKVEMPDLEAVYQERGDELVVLGVDLQESVADVKTFLNEEIQVTYPILMDEGGKVANGFNMFTQPTSYLLDKDGIIRDRKFGAFTPEELQDRVQTLLSTTPSTSKEENNSGVAKTSKTTTATTDSGQAKTFATSDSGGAVASTLAIDSTAVEYGYLLEKFFGPGEIKQIGLDIDLQQVPYRADIDLERLRLGCPVVDCIASIDAPRFETVAEADWLEDDNLVISVEFNGISRAYATNILNWHEIVNDDFEGTPVVVSYCPLCNSATAFVAPVLQGETARFGVSGRLYNSNLVMYDRVTKSMWSEIERKVIVGPLAGASPDLDFIPLDMVPWAQWASEHPQGQVLARPTTLDPQGGKPPRDTDPANSRMTKDYDVDPYAFYKTNNYDTFGLKIEDRRFDNKTMVVGIEIEGAAKAYPRDTVEAEVVINDEINGIPVVLVFDEGTGKVSAFERPSSAMMALRDDQLSNDAGGWQLDGTPVSGTSTALQDVLSMPVFWFAWAAFHPGTEIYGLERSTE